MSNNSKKPKGNKTKYEGQEYLDYTEAADYLGIKRATLYNYINDLDIETLKFKRDRRRYLTLANVKNIEQVMEKPWMGEIDRKEKGSGEDRKKGN